jgi:peptide-methionine (S)-S-oxide reductase
MASFGKRNGEMSDKATALPGRSVQMSLPDGHYLNGRPLGLVPAGFEAVEFGMGCFWGAERLFWNLPGVWVTSVGYGGGYTPNPSYEEVCSGQTGHTELVRVIYDPIKTRFEDLLRVFWEGHDPTQGMRQSNDVGSQYRSAIYTATAAQAEVAQVAAQAYEQRLKDAKLGAVTTEITQAGPYYFAEDYHQQYLAKNPAGYCGIGGTGVSCPIGTGA